MKNNRRIVALVLSIAMMVSMIPATVMADEEEEVFPEEIVETGYEPEGEQEEQLPEEQAEDETVPDEDGSPADEEVPVEVPEEEPVEEPADIVVDEIIDITDIDEVEIPAADDKIPIVNPDPGVISPSTEVTEYVDETGSPQYLTEEVTSLTGTETALDSGWYIAEGEIDFPVPVDIDGDVKIILADGCDVDAIQFITADDNDDTIRFYGQSNGNGKIKISSAGVNDGISMENIYFNGGIVNISQDSLNEAVLANMVTINRGEVNIICTAADNDSINGIQTYSLTMRGGELNVSGFNVGVEGKDTGNLIFAGGELNISGCRCGIYAPVATTVYLIGGKIDISGSETGAGIEAYGNSDVYLGCSSASDSIKVSSFDVEHDITVDGGKSLKTSDGSIVISAVLTYDEITAISGKTLVRVSEAVTYIDENGVEQSVNDPVYLNGYENSLTAGFYVAAGEMDLDKISISGDVRIILTNGCELTLDGFTHTPDSRPGEASEDILTFYGQEVTELGDKGWGVCKVIGADGPYTAPNMYRPEAGINADAVNFFGGYVEINAVAGVQVDNGNVTVDYGVENGYVRIDSDLVGLSSLVPSVCSLKVEEGKLLIMSEDPGDLPPYYGIQGIGSLATTVNGGFLSVNAHSNYDTAVCGIYAPIKVTGGRVAIAANSSAAGQAVGINADGFIESGTDVKEYNSVCVTGGDLYVEPISENGSAYGIIAGSDVRFTGGTVRICGSIARILPRDIEVVLGCNTNEDSIRIDDDFTEYDVYRDYPDDSPYDVVDPDPEDPYEGDIVGPTSTPTPTPDPYPWGRGELTVKIVDGGAVKNGDGKVFFGTVAEENYPGLIGTPLTKAEKPDIRIYGYSVQLNGSIGVKPVIVLPDEAYDDTSARIVFSVGGEDREIPVKDHFDRSMDNYYNYYCSYICNLSAKQMTDVVKISYVSDSGSLELADEGDHEFTVLKYADYIKNNHNVGSHETNDLVYSLLNYGAKAQKIFKYGDQGAEIEQYLEDHSGDFYNCPKSITEAGIDVNDYYSYRSDWANGIRFYGSSLVLKSDLRLKLYFEVDGYDARYIQVSKGTIEAKGDMVIVTLELDNIKDLMDVIELSIYPGSGVSSGSSFKIAPSRYIAKVLSDDSSLGSDLNNVCEALALYYRGAKNYGVG
ncbi:MAG: hypothetical protein IKE53_02915 [Clostridiales bacterium]|nr:hypothetical protein [Clostridiales bacterium]